MRYKSILTVVTEQASVAALISGAAKLCAEADGHLDVLALGLDHTQVGYAYVGAGIALMQVSLDQAEAEARQLEAAVGAAVRAESPGLRVGIESAVTQIGAVTELVGRRASFADLVVLPQPYGAGRAGLPDRTAGAEAVLEAALFEARSPVLVMPATGLPSALPRHIVIAWNQSREALAAVRAALPMLAAADRVTITVIDPPVHGAERSDPGGLLCQMLVRHGVPAEVSVLARTLPRVADVLQRHLRETGADLLVMGAYGHSRFREAILGGATRSMLEEAQIPVLMAH